MFLSSRSPNMRLVLHQNAQVMSYKISGVWLSFPWFADVVIVSLKAYVAHRRRWVLPAKCVPPPPPEADLVMPRRYRDRDVLAFHHQHHCGGGAGTTKHARAWRGEVSDFGWVVRWSWGWCWLAFNKLSLVVGVWGSLGTGRGWVLQGCPLQLLWCLVGVAVAPMTTTSCRMVALQGARGGRGGDWYWVAL